MPIESDKTNNNRLIICLWCGQPAQIIWVHGHGQCSSCGTNIDECCRGEQCANNLQPAHFPGSNNKQ